MNMLPWTAVLETYNPTFMTETENFDSQDRGEIPGK